MFSLNFSFFVFSHIFREKIYRNNMCVEYAVVLPSLVVFSIVPNAYFLFYQVYITKHMHIHKLIIFMTFEFNEKAI